MLNTILKKLNLCRVEELDDARRTIESQKLVLSESHKRCADLKDQNNFMRTQLNTFTSKQEELISDLGARDEEISKLNQELADERHRHDRLQDFEVAESKEYAACKAELKAYKDADKSGLLIKIPCLPGSIVYWVSRGFDETVKPYSVEFDENLGYAIIGLTVRAIIKNDKGCMVLMDATSCIENMPSFHIDDFGKCVFTNIDDANALLEEIVENSTKVESRPVEEDTSVDTEVDAVVVEPDESEEAISSGVDMSPDEPVEIVSTTLPEE